MSARPEHELALVGALLTWPDVEAPDLDPSDFTAPSLGRIFAWLRDRGDQPRELGVLAADLGDDLFTVAAEAMTQAAGASSVPDLALRIRAAATERRARAVGRDLAAGKLAPAEARQLLDQLDQPTKAASARRQLPLTEATSLRVESIPWLWTDRVPLKGITLLVGREGLGKSTLAMLLAARLSRGVLDGDITEPARTLVATFEDDPASTLLPRFLASGGDRRFLAFIEGGLVLPRDLGALEGTIAATSARLVIVDPLSAALGGGKVDTHRDADVRSVLAELFAIAKRRECAFVGVGHWSKGQSGEPLDRVLGSRAFTASSRAVLALGKLDDQGALGLALSKSNLGRRVEDVPTLALRVEPVEVEADGLLVLTSHVVITGTVEATARDLLRGPEESDRAAKRGQAEEWLGEALADGPRLARELEEAAKAEGISKRTLDRAKSTLGVVSRREGGQWVWSLPEEASVPRMPSAPSSVPSGVGTLKSPAQDAQIGQGCQVAEVGIVGGLDGTVAEEPRQPRSLDGLPRLPERHALLRLWDATPQTRELAAVVGAQLLAAWRGGRVVTVPDLVAEFGTSRDELRRAFGALRVRVVREVVEPLPEVIEALEYEEVGA